MSPTIPKTVLLVFLEGETFFFLLLSLNSEIQFSIILGRSEVAQRFLYMLMTLFHGGNDKKLMVFLHHGSCVA